MWIVLACLGAAALVSLALWAIQRGEGASVVGSGNAFNAYYGKNRFSPGQTPPCSKCAWKCCIGAGECLCKCHRAAKTKPQALRPKPRPVANDLAHLPLTLLILRFIINFYARPTGKGE